MTDLKEKFIPVKNPYIVGDPIKDSKMFFGREQDFQNLRRQIDGGGAHVLLLIAGRRSGKTSLLFEIQRGRLKEIAEAVFVDFHELVPQLRENEDFPKLIGEAILQNPAFSSFTEEFRRRDRNNWTTQLIFLVDRCLEVIKPRKLLLLCDEFESIEDCFNQRRLDSEALLWTRPILDKSVFFIMTGSHNFESKIVSKALSNLSQILNIQALAKEDAENLICQPVFGDLYYNEEVVSQILRLSGNQPFYIQFLCNTLVNQNNAVYQHTTLVPEDLDDTLKYIFKNPHNHIEDTWKNPLGHHRLGNTEQLTQAHHVLATLANTLKSPAEYADTESILATATDRDFTVSKETIRTTVGWLKHKHSPLLETHIEKDCYRFQIDLLRRWIAYRFRFGEDVEVYRESQPDGETTILVKIEESLDKQVHAYLKQLQELLQEDTITLTERQLLDKSATDLEISSQQAVLWENQVRAQLRLPNLDWQEEYKESCRVLQRQSSPQKVSARKLRELKATYEERERVSPSQAEEIRQYLGVAKKGRGLALWVGIIVGLLLLIIVVGALIWWFKTEEPRPPITGNGHSTTAAAKVDKPPEEATSKPESTTTEKPPPDTPTTGGQKPPVEEPKVTSIQGYDFLVVDLDKATNKKKLFLVNSSAVKPLLEGVEEEQSHPSISLDNQFLAFQQSKDGKDEICLINLAQQKRIWPCQPGKTPAFAPDGSKVVYVSANKEALGIWHTDTQLSTTVRIEDVTEVSFPVFLPGSQHIVFIAQKENVEILLYNSKETGTVKGTFLTSCRPPATLLVASPTQNLVLCRNNEGWFSIEINLDSISLRGPSRKVSISPNARLPYFSKDGNRLYYIDGKTHRIAYSPITELQAAQEVKISLTEPKKVVPLR